MTRSQITRSGYIRVETNLVRASRNSCGRSRCDTCPAPSISTSCPSTNSVAAGVYGAKADGTKLTLLGSFTATSASIPTSLTVSTIIGYNKIIVSPTSGLTGTEKLHLNAYQVK